MTQQNATAVPNISLRTVITRSPLLAFFALAFLFTWPFLIADALGSFGLIPFRLVTSGPGVLITILMGYGPTFAALLVSAVIGGRAEVGTLLRRLLIWRVGVQWYAAAILGPATLFFLAAQIYVLLGGSLRSLPPVGLLEVALNVLLLLIVHSLVNGEELGWRGFALPRLQNTQSALMASIILGAVWAFFHLPLFFTQGGGVGGSQAGMPALAFVIQVIASSILLTWLFNHTRGSVLLACLFHAATNTWSELFAARTTDGSLMWLQTALFCAAALAVVLIFGATNLARNLERVRQ